ncbi:hypothetical protein MHU86_25634 [Fragilaria crotonensis]|nr:hypothetical protein MHU86_25634 [Fragilaria crotonensis]
MSPVTATTTCTSSEEETIITDVYCKPIIYSAPADGDKRESPLSDYERLQLEHRATLEALRLLAEGVRIVTRQMKQQHFNDDNDSVTSGTSDTTTPMRGRTFSNGTVSVCSFVSDDDKRIDDLTQSLDGIVGADLLGLSQAAQMVNEHARLASQEASILTDDMALAAVAAQDALERAVKAEKAAMRLHRENVALQHQLDQLMVDRKVLAKEIKSIRRDNALLKQYQQDSKRQEMMLALEHHVRGALLVHEKQLAAANRNTRAESWDYADKAPTEIADAPTGTDAPEIVEASENQAEPPSAFVVISPPMEKSKPQIVTTRSVGFGGAGLAGYGYKFNRPKQPLKVSKTVNKIEAYVETPTAATVATVEMTPDVSNCDENGNKENVTKEIRFSNAGRNIMGELTSASSTFTSFFSSRMSKETAAAAPENASLNRDLASQLSVSSPTPTTSKSGSDVPPSVVMDAPSIPSPFADDSPISASSHRQMECPIQCDESILRSLSLPEEESRIYDGLTAIPDTSTSGLYEA